jgi:hypothetical protein
MTPPFITAWSSEEGTVIRPDPLIHNHPALFSERGKHGLGTPVWGRIAEERQRLCAVTRRCQVCAERVGPVGFAIAMTIEPVESPLPMRAHEPLVCARCIPASFRCPKVRERYQAGHLYVIAVGHYDLAMAVHTLGSEECEADIAISKALRAAGLTEAVGMLELFIRAGDVLSIQKIAEHFGLVLP